MSDYELFLGGHDAEMKAIADLAEENQIPVHDVNLGWGAKASEYIDKIRDVILQGKIAVLIELEYDLPEDIPINKVKIIDHHNKDSDKEASIFQFADLIGTKRNRMMGIIAGNDTGYIPGMEKAGATTDEIAQIRRIDREQQGITKKQEKQAEEAIVNMERFPELDDLIIIHMPHSKTATVTDRLYGSQKDEHILILSDDGETNYHGGNNHPDLIKALYNKYAGWKGQRFWGGYVDQNDVEAFIKNELKKSNYNK